LKERRHTKQLAWEKYSTSISTATQEELSILKSKCTRVSKKNVEDVKHLMDTYRVPYVDAPYEADELCAKFMLTGTVYACISDDTDMLIYGCNKVIRKIDLDNKSAELYDLNRILSSLKMTHYEFKQICIVSGSDYYKSNLNLFECIKIYKKFKHSGHENFYVWMCIHSSINYEELMTAFQNYNLLDAEFDYLSNYIIKPQEQESASESGGSCIAVS
jgi:5'-3' exonuclease